MPITIFNIPHTHMIFNGGESHVILDNSFVYQGEDIDISGHIRSPSDIMELLLVTDALKRAGVPEKSINLTLPYLPYARQDRVSNRGESLSLKVFCDLINSQKYKEVSVWDCHSDVGLALLNNVYHLTQDGFIESIPETSKKILVSPDAGAIKKVSKSSHMFERTVYANKHRDTLTGKLSNTTVNCSQGELKGKTCLIADDICDNGGTFIELAKVLKEYGGAESVELYVTHLIAGKGTKVFDGLIDVVYYANAFERSRLDSTVVKHVHV